MILNQDLQVVYEDNHLLVVIKPHRLLIQSDQSGSPTLFKQVCDWLKDKYQKPGNVYLGMVHRLDRPASGLVVFAKTSKAASRLSEQIRQRKVAKKYHLLVEGEPSLKQQTCVHYVTNPQSGRSEVFEVEKENTKRAELNYEVRSTKKGVSLVSVELITGRRHQIRAQMAYLGHSLLGDGRYGSQTPFLEGSIALAACELELVHPTQGNLMKFQLPADKDSVLRFWDAF